MRRTAFLLVVSALLGCSGRDGSVGAMGPGGAVGPSGAAGAAGVPAQTSGFIEGAVRDASSPLLGVAVSASPGGLTTTTGSDGRFHLGPLPIGGYALTFNKNAFEPATATATVLGGVTTQIDVSLMRRTTGTVRGTVRFESGTPVPNAEVSTDRHGARTATDAQGRYTLVAPATTYAVIAVPLRETYATATANDVVVVAAGEGVVDFVLKPRPLGSSAYIGSSACAQCHPSHFTSWQGTLHNNSIRAVDDPVPGLGGGVLAPWTGAVTLARGANINFSIELGREGGGYRATLVDAAGVRRAFEVLRTQGGGAGWTQRYQAKVAGLYQLLPLQWNEATRAFAPYKPEYWFDAQGLTITPTSRVSFEQQCIGCHSTGLQISHDGNQLATGVRYTESNIGCEACHGAGSQHALSRSADDILNPRRLMTRTAGVVDEAGNVLDRAAYDGYLRANEVCGHCHSRGVSNAATAFQSAFAEGTHGFPWLHARGDEGAYRVGEKLDWFLADRAERWGDTRYDRVSSAAAHNQQWQDMLEDRKGGATHAKNPSQLVACFDCHNPHGSSFSGSARQPAGDNALCASCHAGKGPFALTSPDDTAQAALLRHTHHFRDSPGDDGQSRCVGCHMPRTAQSALPRDIASHTFRTVVPHESVAMRNAGQTPVPNSCDQCHRNDPDLGVLRYELFFGPPVPVTP